MNPLLQPNLNGAFLADGYGCGPVVELTTASPLAGLRLAVKDVFNAAGFRTGAGNPVWRAEQLPAEQTAKVVQWLLRAGCEWVGKTVTDELTYSLAGVNTHYGTPVNPRAPERLPGGSSSGSAVAVAARHADIALGTDCGGSVRLPASYCGIWGIRPSHGRIATDGCFTLAHSLDTVGWFSRTGAHLAAAFNCMANSTEVIYTPAKLLISADVLTQLDLPVQEAFQTWLHALDRPFEVLPKGALDLERWADAFRLLQASEVWQQHGEWVSSRSPNFGADVALRFAQAASVSAEDVAGASYVRQQATASLAQLLGEDGVLLMPPVPGVAPLLQATAETVQDTRARSQRLLCMAGLSGLPQVVMPWTTLDGAPVGLSLMGPRLSDERLLAVARELTPDAPQHSEGLS